MDNIYDYISHADIFSKKVCRQFGYRHARSDHTIMVDLRLGPKL